MVGQRSLGPLEGPFLLNVSGGRCAWHPLAPVHLLWQLGNLESSMQHSSGAACAAC